MAGILSKGIKLGYKATSGSTSYTDISNLQEIPDLGGDVDQVDVTCLADESYHYIPGIKDYGSLEFTFLYDNSEETSNYRVCKKLADAEKAVDFEVEFPDGTKFDFTAIPTVKVNGAAVNAALQFTLSLSLQSDISTPED